MYGHVGDNDFYNKTNEFEAYVREVMNEEPTMLGKREQKEAWKSYCEDYNTATFTSEKYYNLAKWEHNQRLEAFKRKQAEDADPDRVRSDFNDEEALRLEQQQEEVKKRNLRMAAELAAMDSEKVKDMMYQDRLKRELQLHLQTGNRAEAERLQKLLSKDEPTDFEFDDAPVMKQKGKVNYG